MYNNPWGVWPLSKNRVFLKSVWVRLGKSGYLWVRLGTSGYVWIRLGTFGYL